MTTQDLIELSQGGVCQPVSLSSKLVAQVQKWAAQEGVTLNLAFEVLITCGFHSDDCELFLLRRIREDSPWPKPRPTPPLVHRGRGF